MNDQLPPHDIDAERCALASMMLCTEDNRVLFRRIRRQLWPGAFFQGDHATIFRALCRMDDANVPVDSVTLRAHLKERGLLEEIGGVRYIADILNSVPQPTSGLHYASIVSKYARKRDAIAVADELKRALLDPNAAVDGQDVIQAAVNRLWQAATAGRDLQIWRLGEALARFVEARKDGKPDIALDTGIAELDRDYRGILTFGGYTLIAARPSMGKSTIIRWILTRFAQAGTPVGLIAIEEKEDKIADNILSSQTAIENNHLAYGYRKWTNHDYASIGSAIVDLDPIPFHGIDTALTLPDVLTAAEMLATQYGCKIIAIDHVHLIDHSRSRAENRTQQLSEISGALKALFKRLGVVGIVAAQLNRPSKETVPPPPHLTDLRDSGSLEEHADAVLMLHRKDYYMRGRDNYSPDGLAQVFIRKNRNGCVGGVILKADLEHQRFEESGPDLPFTSEE